MNKDCLHLGLDVGAVNVRIAVIDDLGQVVHFDTERIVKGPVATVAHLLDILPENIAIDRVISAGVVGSGRHIYDGQEGWQLFTSPYAAIVGLVPDHPDARTIISIGGQSSLVIGLEGGPDRPWRVARSPLCAAGTGRFLEQQASRLGISIEEFGARALRWTEQPPRVAARCSVFAKSDLIHLQQKAWPIEAMLAGLSDSIARMIQAQWHDSFEPPIYFIGGVAANGGVVRALENVLGQEVIVPSSFEARETIGAALLARDRARSGPSVMRPAELYPRKQQATDIFYLPRHLPRETSPDGWTKPEFGVVDAYLGVDVGSTSTKAVVVDAAGNVLAKTYLMTAGQPLEAVKKVMANLAPEVESKVRIKGVGATGSGRYLVGNFIGADSIKNEITAQTRAALLQHPRVSTIFELGGQDSKYVYIENGTVLDYQMNKACAAGTGSFIDELAEQLGVPTREQPGSERPSFGSLAFLAQEQLDLGEKCAAFMSQAVTSAQHAGAPIEVIVSSLATSLAKNYLSKVVGNRRVGDCVLLTGAVFYNAAVISAFKAELPGKEFIVPVHKEVTGAIGAALLAMEAMTEASHSGMVSEPEGTDHKFVSKFKGFSRLANESYKLTNFNCHKCENTCAISVMTSDAGAKLFYGSRCDLFDAEAGKGKGKPSTPFSAREALLFADYDASKGAGGIVGVPRAMLAYDLAPMLTGFLNALGLRVRYTSATNKQIIEQSLERAYTDSCFPIKLLHGHVAELVKERADHILIPNAIRMGKKDSERDQHYSCPLVQSAPYIVKSVFQLGDKLLDPVIDFSRGDEAVIRSFSAIARRLGFGEKDGRRAIEAGLAKQREFDKKAQAAGQKILDELADDPDAIGIVLLARAYNAQDQGANLGMAEEIAKLGVVPIPLDFLPLDTVDVQAISDRPYWNYERKILAASKLIAEHPRLFGLFLSNFGCGPNSFIQSVVEDIMGGKPLGQIELDEHAAEAGYITRLEALVDTIKSYQRSGLQLAADPAKYSRTVPTAVRAGQNVVIPAMADHAGVVAGAMRHYGVNAQVLPESDERSMALSRDVTSGKECLPFRDSLGVFLRAAEDGLLPPNARALMAGSFGPCRLGKYAQEQQKILTERGIALEVLTTVSNNAYADLGLGVKFELLAWQGIVATDLLQKMLWMTRPYERQAGAANRAYEEFLTRLTSAMETKAKLEPLLAEAQTAFTEVRDPALPRRPLVGINGEIYLRANRFCNKDLAQICETNGLEVEVAPMAEWIKYITLRNIEDARGNKEAGRWAKGYLRKLATEFYENRMSSWVNQMIHEPEPGPDDLLATSSSYVPSRNGSEAVLSIGSGVRQMRDPRFAGVISVMPHGCMPGGIVAAFAEQITKEYGNKPWISLTFDGFPDKVNAERIADFAQQVRHRATTG